MSASLIWEWLTSLSLLFGLAVKITVSAFLIAAASEFGKKIVARMDEPEDPP